ncbi:MAG: DUF2993 domain-containing protein [Spirulinaceae cyanobacterium]
MEFLTLLLTGLLNGVTPTGFILDTVTEQNLRSRLPGSDEIIVRVDSTPTHQVLSGRVDRVRLATRGLQLTPYIRVEALEVDSDPISLRLGQLQDGVPLRQTLREPLQGGVRLVLNEDDLNASLAAPEFSDRLDQIANRIAGRVPGSAASYDVEQVTVDFLGQGQEVGERFQVDARVRSPESELTLTFAADLTLEQGAVLGFDNVTVALNGEPLAGFINEIITANLVSSFDLRQLESQGIIVRLLQLEVTTDELHLAAFAHLAPDPAPAAAPPQPSDP